MRLGPVLLLLLVLSVGRTYSDPTFLVVLNQTRVRSSSPCCLGPNLLSCYDATVEPASLVSGQDIMLPGSQAGTLSFSNQVAPHGFHYTSPEGDEATFTLRPDNKAMFGALKTGGGLSYSLERCGSGHVWQQYDLAGLGDDEVVKLPTDNTSLPIMDMDVADETTKAVYSVMFYYTQSFMDITTDIDGYIDQVLAETNQGYINSDVNLEVVKLCVEKATVDDQEDGSDLLKSFKEMKSPLRKVRNTADAAVLLVADFESCGIAYLNTLGNGYTLSVAKKSCALGYYSFGHELGHNFGLAHNPEKTSDAPYSYGHGHLIEKDSTGNGYRTILAYSATGHKSRINYYSNPNILLASGVPTGVADISDNARLLRTKRFKMSAIGDESAACFPGFPSTSSEPAVTTTSPVGSCSASGCTGSLGTCQAGSCIFPFTFKDTGEHNTCTDIDGDTKPWCATSVDGEGELETFAYCSIECPGPCTASGCTSSLGTCQAGPCVLPFIFNGTEHNTCTDIDGEPQPWCATSVDREGNLETWAHCSVDCPGMGTTPAPTTTPTTTTTQAPSTCMTKNKVPVLKTLRTKKNTKVSTCMRMCVEESQCSYFKWKKKKGVCYLLKAAMVTKRSYSSGPRVCSTAANTVLPSGCLSPNKIPVLKPFKVQKKVAKVSQCLQLCLNNSKCEYFKWKKKTCYLLSGAMVSKKGFTSGPRNCNA